MLTKDAILNTNESPLYPVEVPEWSGAVYVPVLSLDGLDDLAKIQKRAGNTNALMAVQIIRDEQGNRVFTDDDAPVLSGKPGFGKIILRILKKFNDVNGLTEAAQEQVAKN